MKNWRGGKRNWKSAPYIVRVGYREYIKFDPRDEFCPDGVTVVCSCDRLPKVSFRQHLDCPLHNFCFWQGVWRNSVDCKFVRYHGLLEELISEKKAK